MSSRKKQNFPLVAGSGLVSGVVGVTVPYPFNVVRCLQQTAHASSTSVVKSLLHVVRHQGVFTGLFRGYFSAVGLYGPATSLFYLTYIKSSEVFYRATKNDTLSNFSAGLAANVAASVLWTPMDNIVQRMWVSQRSASEVAGDIYARGGLPGFWRAYTSTLGVWSPLVAVFFATYEFAIQEMNNSAVFSRYPGLTTIAAGATSASVAVFCTNPLDVIRVRYQISTDSTPWRETFLSTIRREGLKLFSIGLRARMLAVVPDMTVGISIFEVSIIILVTVASVLSACCG